MAHLRTISTASPWSDAQAKAIRTEITRILGSGLFVHAKRLRRFLEFIVSETLAGRPDSISAYTVGVEAYDRDHGFDPMLDPIVRQRLRAKLREYYDEEGRSDPIRIGLARGSYAPTIRWRGVVFDEAPKGAL